MAQASGLPKMINRLGQSSLDNSAQIKQCGGIKEKEVRHQSQSVGQVGLVGDRNCAERGRSERVVMGVLVVVECAYIHLGR